MRFLTLAVLALCAACGQAGALYLPERESTEPQPIQPASETPADEPDGKKKETP